MHHASAHRARATAVERAAPASVAMTPKPRVVPLGNQALLRRLQPKLTVGAVDDPLEREADDIADKVMRMPDPALSIDAAPLQISRKCEACEKEDDDEKKLQMKPTAASRAQIGEAPGIVQNVLQSPGQQFDAASRAYFEPRFGQDFSGVRVHADSRAAESAGSIGASAYTAGANIAFAAGRYEPAAASGRRLLAHELTHVVQQRALSPGGAFSGAAVIQRDGPDPNSIAYKQGYNQGYSDGQNGLPSQAASLDGDVLTGYNEGYAQGSAARPATAPAPGTPQPSADASQPVQQTVSYPALADGGAAPAQAKQGPNLDSIAYKQGGDDAKNGRPLQPAATLNQDAVADYKAGYAEGSALGPSITSTPVQADTTPGSATAAGSFQDRLSKDPAMSKAYTPIYATAGALIGYSRSASGYIEVRNTDGEVVYSDELPLEHGLPIIDTALDLIEQALKQVGYVAIGTLDTIFENNWRALGLPVDTAHKEPFAQRLGIPLDATAYTIGRGAGHALTLLETAGAYIGGATLFISGVGEFMAGVATTPEGVGVIIAPVGVLSIAKGSAAIIYGGALGHATLVNMMSAGGGGESSVGENGPYGDITDNTKIAPGRDFQPGQKPKIIEANKAKNGGKILSDDPADPYQVLSDPKQAVSQGMGGSGLDPAMAEIDHIVPASAGGTNSYGNARVISKFYNNLLRAKGAPRTVK